LYHDLWRDELRDRFFTAAPRRTEAIRRATNSHASSRELAGCYGINPKTVAKWSGRTSVFDEGMGPKKLRSTVLSKEEEALIVAFRMRTPLAGSTGTATR
jgi:hypothetical protein